MSLAFAFALYAGDAALDLNRGYPRRAYTTNINQRACLVKLVGRPSLKVLIWLLEMLDGRQPSVCVALYDDNGIQESDLLDLGANSRHRNFF